MQKEVKGIKRKRKIVLVIILLLLSIGYAVLSANMHINGNSKIANSSWDIHFENVVPNQNSVSIGNGDQGATITPGKTTEVTYNVTLDKPGDFYEFEVDAVNSGSIDAMVDTVSSTIKIGDGEAVPITDESLPDYLTYSATYSDDVEILQNHELNAGTSETYKVRVEFIKDIENNQLPANDHSIIISFEVDYVQANSNKISPHPVPNGVRITDSDEISKMGTLLGYSEASPLDVMKITAPSNVYGQFWIVNEEQMGLFKMCYNYRFKMATFKKVGDNYELIDLSTTMTAPSGESTTNFSSLSWIDVDYAKYEDNGGDYECAIITYNQENLDLAGGEIYIYLYAEAEIYPGLTPAQVGQRSSAFADTNKLSIVSNTTDFPARPPRKYTVSSNQIGQVVSNNFIYYNMVDLNNNNSTYTSGIYNDFSTNNIITESYAVLFIDDSFESSNPDVTQGEYKLRGGVNESSLATTAVYNSNRDLLLTAFGNSNCTEDSTGISCSKAGVTAYAEKSGNVGAGNSNHICTVNQSGVSSCS